MMRRGLAIVAVILIGASACMAAGYYRQLMMLPRAAGDVAPPASSGFITLWSVTNGGSITLPLRSGYNYNMTVDYGDGTVVNVNSNNDPDATHQYTTGGSNRVVVINGTNDSWYFNNGGSRLLFRGVSSWGPITVRSNAALNAAFYGCSSATGFGSSVDSSWSVVRSLDSTWFSCSSVKDGLPDISNLTNITSYQQTWRGCSANTGGFPSVTHTPNATRFDETWRNCSAANVLPSLGVKPRLSNINLAWSSCSAMTNSVQHLLGDCLWITGQLKNVSSAFNGCSKLSGQGMPLVTAITNSPGYPTGYTITTCFSGCTNLSDYADIPAGFK